MLVFELTDAFDKNNLKYAIVGGYALALHGIIRATVDVDFVLRLRQEDFEKAESILKSLRLQSRIPVRAQDIIAMREEFITERNLIAWSFVDYNDPARQVDILITQDLSNTSTVKISVGNRKVSVATLEELLKMKMASGRPQDLIDIEKIKEKLHGKKT